MVVDTLSSKITKLGSPLFTLKPKTGVGLSKTGVSFDYAKKRGQRRGGIGLREEQILYI